MIGIDVSSLSINKLSTQICRMKEIISKFDGTLNSLEISTEKLQEMKGFELTINGGCNWRHEKDRVKNSPFPGAEFYILNIPVYGRAH